MEAWPSALAIGVDRGDRLGLVGMSGNTEFPHVELSIRRNGATLDPFTGREVFSGCGKANRSLWHEDARPSYRAFQVVAVGFATGRADMESLQRDAASPTVLSADAPALVLWVITLGIEPGDRLNLRIVGPDGNTVFSQEKGNEADPDPSSRLWRAAGAWRWLGRRGSTSAT